MSFDFKGRLAEGLNRLDIDLGDESLDSLEKYFNELKKWSRRLNLIARSSSDEDILEKHFIDSLTILPLLGASEAHLLDVGTGAGFPGLVCKAVRDDLKLTLVEPRQKKVSFLRHIIRILELHDVKVLNCRIEDESRLPSTTPFTHITGRAVSDLKVFLGMVERFGAAGAKVICMKGPKWQEEVAEATEAANKTFICHNVIEQVLPIKGGRLVLLVYTPNKACRMKPGGGKHSIQR